MLGSVALSQFRSNKRIAALKYGYRAQAVVLLMLAIPIAFSGASISIGWAAVALALAAIGAKLDDKPARYAAVVAWVLAILNGIAWAENDATRAAAHAEWLNLLGQPILAWMVIGWSLAAVGHATAWLISRATRRQRRC